MVRLFSAKAFQSIEPIKVLVVGDFMLDTYTIGTVDRISPEAPVPVLKVREFSSKAGGAGNVVLNLLSLGATVFAMGRVGGDKEGLDLCSFLDDNRANTDYLFKQDDYCTPVKHRLIAESQHVIRVDRETNELISSSLEEKIISILPNICEKVQVIAISDYAKGFLSDTLLQAIICEAKKHDIPVIVDPKGIDFTKYKGATIVKPNAKEAYGASKLSASHSIDEVAQVLQKEMDIQSLIITRSADGISLFDKGKEPCHFPVSIKKEIRDATGAGDTVLAMLSMAVGNRLDLPNAIKLANLAASISVEQIGCAHVSLSDVARRLLRLDFANKIYDESHIFALKQAVKGHSYSIVALDSEEGVSASLFNHLHDLAKEPQKDLICYIKDSKPNEAYLSLLSSLKEVDFIVLQKRSLESLCEDLQPSQVFEMKGEMLVKWDTHIDLLKSIMEYSYTKTS